MSEKMRRQDRLRQSTATYAGRMSVFFKKVAQVAGSAEELAKAIHTYGEIVRGINNYK